MNLLSKEDIKNLFDKREKFCVSIYMSAEKAGKETRKNPIRFKNLLQEAESKLVSAGLTTSELDKFLEEARLLVDNYNFWQHQEEGLACFITYNKTNYYKLPHNFPESLVLSDRFYLKPLLPLVMNDQTFYLLALAQNEIRLFQGSEYSIKQLELPEDVPTSLAEALRYDDPEKQLQFHSASQNQSPVYHGQGVGTTDDKNEILRYFQKIDQGLSKFLEQEQKPLLLAGVEYLFSIYQQANSYSHLLSEGVTGNPENLSPKELHSSAWQIIKPYFDKDKEVAKQQYQELLTTKQASAELKQIIPAAYNGQIDTLFLTRYQKLWGKFEPKSNSIEIEDSSSQDNLDLLDFAAIHTFLQGGTVYILDSEQMPETEEIATAIYRYPVYANS